MIHNSEPSQLFLDSIHTAFHLAQGQGEITPSAIWDHVVGICIRRHIMPDMFAWDVRRKPNSKRNRIADIAETRILESEVLVPRFILAELQAIADSEDKLKRNRGRRGLDVLNRLQTSEKIDIRIMDARVPEVEQLKEVDAKLVALAEHLDARIVTNDYNLNKIAQLRGVDVVNVNDLANALKPIVLPGETMSVKIIKPGEEPGQGVGYLEDGTMVVAEQGRDYIGRQVVITVTSVLQTSAGRMIFGRTDAEKTLSPRERRT